MILNLVVSLLLTVGIEVISLTPFQNWGLVIYVKEGRRGWYIFIFHLYLISRGNVLGTG